MPLGFLFMVARVLASGLGAKAEEQALIARLQAGDERAFVELLERFQAPVERLARRFVSSQALAEEVVQETWLAVLKGIDRFEGRSSLKTWIFTILSNRAKTRGQRESRTQPFSSMGAGNDAQEDAVDPDRFTAGGAWAAPPGRWHEAHAFAQLQSEETLGIIEKAIGNLPENQQTVLRLRDVEGLRERSL